MNEIADIRESIVVVGRSRAAAFAELTKPRITAMVLLAVAVGFYLALPGGPVGTDLALLMHALFGTALVVGGANALNQLMEAEADRRMARTCDRPLPSRRLSSGEAAAFTAVTSLLGVVYLTLMVRPLTGLLAAAALVSYAFAYTPLKRSTPASVFVGAIPGALPPVIGWAAAGGSLGRGAALLFLILFFWQLPHFAAIGWLYRRDYRRAGYPVLAVVDAGGWRIARHVVTHSVALLMASLLPFSYGLTGAAYAVAAFLVGMAFLAAGVAFVAHKTEATARLHVHASLLYLPLLFAFMVVDKAT